jgi:hypothetical protein
MRYSVGGAVQASGHSVGTAEVDGGLGSGPSGQYKQGGKPFYPEKNSVRSQVIKQSIEEKCMIQFTVWWATPGKYTAPFKDMTRRAGRRFRRL